MRLKVSKNKVEEKIIETWNKDGQKILTDIFSTSLQHSYFFFW